MEIFLSFPSQVPYPVNSRRTSGNTTIPKDIIPSQGTIVNLSQKNLQETYVSSSHWQAFSEQAAAFLEYCFAKSKEMGVKPVCWSFAIYYVKILPYKIKILFIIFLSETDRSNGYLTHTKNLRSPTKGLTKPPPYVMLQTEFGNLYSPSTS